LAFSTPEQRLLERLDPKRRRDCFARLWTRKESYIKADGRGMSLPLRYIDAGSDPNRILLWDEGSQRWAPARRWTVRALPAPLGYVAALTSEGEVSQPLYKLWQDGP
jgi:4'-phosphopantetheinyl transferase